MSTSTKKWAYGITTVVERKHTTLPPTMESLRKAGFPTPRFFVDNSQHVWEEATGDHDDAFNGLGGITYRNQRIRAYGNWLLALVELVIREPLADFYALFQDDLETYVNLRLYLEQCRYPSKGYWNLYTVPSNHEKIPPDPRPGKQGPATGWFVSNQRGQGAVGLVFNRAVAYQYLGHPHGWNRLIDPKRGWQAIDGSVVACLARQGIQEWIHSPSLVGHTGTISTMHLDSLRRPECGVHNQTQPQATTFRGKDFNALSLLEDKVTP